MTNNDNTSFDEKVSSAQNQTKSEALSAFAFRLTRYRQAKKWSQADLARAAGLTKDSIHKYSTGERLPRPDTLIVLADALSVSPSDLLPSAVDSTWSTEAADGAPPFEMRLLPGRGGKAQLRLRCVLSSAAAIRVAAVVQKELNEAEAAEAAEREAAGNASAEG